MDTVMVHARVNKDSKEKAESILNQLGVTTSKAIDLFLRQVSLHNGLPFPLEVPTETTLKIMKEVKEGKNLIEVSSEEFDELVEECVK